MSNFFEKKIVFFKKNPKLVLGVVLAISFIVGILYYFALGSPDSAGAVGFWPFNEAYGSTAYDESGSGNNGTISGASWKSEDMCVVGKCLQFDGTDDYVSVPDNASLDVTTSGLTVEAWIRPNGVSDEFQAIMAKGNNISTSTDPGEGISGNSTSSATQIYYSVGQNTSDHKVGSPTISISSGVATFSEAQTGTTTGVGDKVTYGAASRVVYITGKITTSQWTVRTATGTLPADVSATTTVSIAHAYDSINNALNGADDSSHLNTQNLSTGNYALNIPCYYDTGADTTRTYIDEYTTGVDNYIRIYTPYDTSTECNQSQRHDGVWNDNRFRMQYSSASDWQRTIMIQEDYVRLEGLQAKFTQTATGSGGGVIYVVESQINANNDIRIYNNILVTGNNSSGDEVSHGISVQDSDANMKIWDNVIYSSFFSSLAGSNAIVTDGDAQVYNNTLMNFAYGIIMGASIVTDAKNNIASTSGSGYYENLGSFAATSTRNICNYTATANLNFGENETGVTTGSATNKLIDSGASFLSTIKVGMIVKDSATNYAYVTSVDSNTQLTLTANYLSSSEAYTIWYNIAGTVSFEDQANDDYHLAADDTLAMDNGVDLSTDSALAFTNDMDRTARTGNWDIGADEYGAYVTEGTNYALYLNYDEVYFKYHDETSFRSYTTAGENLEANKWYHVVYRRDGSDEAIFINGLKIKEDSFSYSLVSNDEIFTIGAETTTGTNAFQGAIDEPKIYAYARTDEQIAFDYFAGNAGAKSDESLSASIGSQSQKWLTEGLVAYWRMDEANTVSGAIDSSGGGNTGTYQGDATTASGHFGNGGNFDGDGDYVEVSNESNFDFDFDDAFSISAWIYRETNSTEDDILGKVNDSTTWKGYTLFLPPESYCQEGNNCLRMSLNYDAETDNSINFQTPIDSIPLNSWTHILVVYDGSSSASGMNIYIDGVKQELVIIGDYDFSSSILNDNNLVLGTDLPGIPDYFDGKIDDVRIYDRELSENEAEMLYKWSPGPVAHWKMDEKSGITAYDTSGNENNLTLTNSPSWSSGKYGSGISFAGSNQHLIQTDDSDFDFVDDASFSITGWFKHNTASAQEIILSKYNEAGYKIIMESDGDITCALDYDGTWTPTDSATSSAAIYDDNNWHHFACVKSGDDSLSLYIDGIFIATDLSLTASNAVVNSDPIYLGINADGTSNDFNGSLDDFRIYGYARTQKQIIEDMNAGRPAIGKPLGYWKFDEGADNRCSGGVNDVCNSGVIMFLDGASTASRTSEGKFDYALDFDGTDDVVTITGTSAIDFCDGLETGFSISSWIFVDSDGEGNLGQIFYKGDSNYLRVSGESGDNLNIDASLSLASSNATLSLTAPIVKNSWNHVIMTYTDDSGNITLYVNGENMGSSDNGSGAPDSCAGNLLIGGTTTANFDGKIDEFKIFNYAFSDDEAVLDFNRGNSVFLGVRGIDSSGNQSYSSLMEYCPPGNTDSCAAPVMELRMNEKVSGNAQTLYDTSGNNISVTTVDGANNTGMNCSRPGKYGSGCDFDGQDDYVRVTTSSPVKITGAMTISLWVYADTWSTASTSGARLISKRSALINCWDFTRESYDGRIYFSVATSSASASRVRVQSSGSPTTGSWVHYVGVFDPGNLLFLYINGKLDSISTSTAPASQYDSNWDIYIGGAPLIGASYIDGRMDDVRIYNYARTPAQIAWEYDRGKPMGHWKMDECSGITVYDEGDDDKNGTLSLGSSGQTSAGECATVEETAWYNGASGKYNSGLNFDGLDDYISIGNPTSTRLTGSASWEAWVKPDSFEDGLSYEIVGKQGAGADRGWRLNKDDEMNTFSVGVSDSSNNMAVRFSNTTIQNDQWYHVVGIYNSSTQALDIYINGKLDNGSLSGTIPSSQKNSTQNVNIGRRPLGDHYFKGIIDEVKIYNYALTAEQVRISYNRGAAFFGQ